MHAFAQLTVPEIKAGFLAVIAFGGAAISLFVAMAMLRAGGRAVARRIARLARTRRTPVGHQAPELAAERAS